jgi:hypothetical protein
MAEYADRHPRRAKCLTRTCGIHVDGTWEGCGIVGRDEIPFVRLTADTAAV